MLHVCTKPRTATLSLALTHDSRQQYFQARLARAKKAILLATGLVQMQDTREEQLLFQLTPPLNFLVTCPKTTSECLTEKLNSQKQETKEHRPREKYYTGVKCCTLLAST